MRRLLPTSPLLAPALRAATVTVTSASDSGNDRLRRTNTQDGIHAGDARVERVVGVIAIGIAAIQHDDNAAIIFANGLEQEIR